MIKEETYVYWLCLHILLFILVNMIINKNNSNVFYICNEYFPNFIYIIGL